jgi:hypothetical protein
MAVAPNEEEEEEESSKQCVWAYAIIKILVYPYNGRMPSSGMSRHVAPVRTDISEERYHLHQRDKNRQARNVISN